MSKLKIFFLFFLLIFLFSIISFADRIETEKVTFSNDVTMSTNLNVGNSIVLDNKTEYQTTNEPVSFLIPDSNGRFYWSHQKMETQSRTIYLTNSMTAGEIQDIIDATGKFIPDGVALTFNFKASTYVLTNTLTFSKFYGGGILSIKGGDNYGLHTNQTTILDFTHNNSNSEGLVVANCSLANWIFISDLHFKMNSTNRNGLIQANNSYGMTISGCYLESGASKLSDGIVNHITSMVLTKSNYFGNVYNVIYTYEGGRVHSIGDAMVVNTTYTNFYVANGGGVITYENGIADGTAAPAGGGLIVKEHGSILNSEYIDINITIPLSATNDTYVTVRDAIEATAPLLQNGVNIDMVFEDDGDINPPHTRYIMTNSISISNFYGSGSITLRATTGSSSHYGTNQAVEIDFSSGERDGFRVNDCKLAKGIKFDGLRIRIDDKAGTYIYGINADKTDYLLIQYCSFFGNSAININGGIQIQRVPTCQISSVYVGNVKIGFNSASGSHMFCSAVTAFGAISTWFSGYSGGIINHYNIATTIPIPSLVTNSTDVGGLIIRGAGTTIP